MTARDYPITQPYGYDPSYPLNNGFHRGIDYGAPEGTPLVVNGVQLGLTGHTGAAYGPHLHLGKWNGGTVLDPGVGNGFDFTDAVVAVVEADDRNGNYIKLTADGYTWIYCHLSRIDVKQGQVLKGAPVINEDLLTRMYRAWLGRDPQQQDKTWIGKSANDLAITLDASPERKQYLAEHPATVPAPPVLKPGLYQVK